ncbi:MAG TPA: hypothetical protein VG815_11920, partial [Chloroflexota bacterium]|nr:hypothetical protein [Chloroflexota bacterium]
MESLSKVWFIAQKDLLQLRRDRGGLLLMFAVPLLLMGILGAAIGNFGANGSLKATLPVIENGNSPQARALVLALR